METLAVKIGNRVTATVEFKDKDGVLADPTEVKLFLNTPDGKSTVEQENLTNESVGVWSHELTPETVGEYWLGFEGTGDVEAYEEALLVAEEAEAQ